jgi:hypothetical protein
VLLSVISGAIGIYLVGWKCQNNGALQAKYGAIYFTLSGIFGMISNIVSQ